MASEIEVVTESQKLENSSSAAVEEPAKNDVYSAAAYGDLETLRRLVEEDGCSVSKPDGGGYYPLQWAALNNHVAVAQYIIEHGGDVNTAGQGGQTALHWAAVRGCVEVAEFLLQNGARVEAADINGYRITHVAAQYGQTSLLHHIITKWSADFDVPDNEGRSPLHWAAFKGFTDCIRLLLFMDAYLGQKDKEGCTPLHWAAIRGNLEACTVIVHAGTKEDLMAKDNKGYTPAEIAADRGQHHVASFLSNARRMFNKQWDENSFVGKIAKQGHAPILLFVMIAVTITFVNSVMASSTFLKVTAVVGLWGWTAVFWNINFLRGLAVEGEMVMLIRERERERKRLIERGLSFASQQDNSDNLTGFEDEEDDERDQGHEEGGELFALLRELAGLQVRLASLMEKMGSLPLDLIRDMRQEVVEVTDQLRNINRSHRR